MEGTLADWDTFELFPVRYGSGSSERTSVHIRVRTWIRPKGFENAEDVICLTAEADDPDELDAHIDELVAELQALKKVGRRKMAQLGGAISGNS